MEVRWRLFARDVLSMTSSFEFGRPLRTVRGLRLLGVVVHRSKPTAGAGLGYAGTRIGTVAADLAGMGILGVDDGTGVVEVLLPQQQWETVALWDQVDVVGRPFRPHSARQPVVLADGCHTETDPNVAILRALECIKLYKLCYFSREWTPSAMPLPPVTPDPWEHLAGLDSLGKRSNGNSVSISNNVQAADSRHPPNASDAAVCARDGRDSFSEGSEGVRGGLTGGMEAGSSGASLEEQLSEIISSLAGHGGATTEKLHSALGVPQGDASVSSALAQLQLDGAIYVTGDRYMPL